MITQSLHFEVTGRDAWRLWNACKERNIEPAQAFELFLREFTQETAISKPDDSLEDELRAKKLAYAGVLSHLANSKLLDIE